MWALNNVIKVPCVWNVTILWIKVVLKCDAGRWSTKMSCLVVASVSVKQMNLEAPFRDVFKKRRNEACAEHKSELACMQLPNLPLPLLLSLPPPFHSSVTFWFSPRLFPSLHPLPLSLAESWWLRRVNVADIREPFTISGCVHTVSVWNRQPYLCLLGWLF